jgi:hypothetical protein
MKKISTKFIGLIALAIVVAFAPSSVSFARDGERTSGREDTMMSKETSDETSTESEDSMTETEPNNSEHKGVSEKRTELKAKLASLKAERQTKLDANRQKVCEQRAEKINAIIQKRSEMATKNLEVFTKISERVQEFVKTKGYTIENYDALVATINDKKAAAQAAITVNSETTFSCSEADGSDVAKLPRESMTAVRDALQAYRTAIKDLIVQVKPAAEADSADATKTEDTTKPAETTEAQ